MILSNQNLKILKESLEKIAKLAKGAEECGDRNKNWEAIEIQKIVKVLLKDL